MKQHGLEIRMRNFFKMAALVVAMTLGTGMAAKADQRTVVEPFYAFLSNPGSQAHADAARAVMADNWESIGNYSGKTKSGDAFIKQIGGFSNLVPDLNWKMEEVLIADDRVIVRGRATGTPKGPMFGVDGKGKGFQIMSIDIHTVENGRIVRTYHIEDWAGALGQLRGK
jgi:predicted ester cyclase